MMHDLAPAERAMAARPLTCYAADSRSAPPIKVAPAARDWMVAAPSRFAMRCLPILIANESGWFLLSTHTLRATWAGGDDASSLRVDMLTGEPPFPAISHFGIGILTWRVPYVFRTPKGYNLLVRGPANWPKDGVYPLEGIVETDWTAASFTMNWKITRPNIPVVFQEGEPFCMILPQRRGDLEEFQPVLQPLASDPDLLTAHRKWSGDRTRFLQARKLEAEPRLPGWQKDYFVGRSIDGVCQPDHQTKRGLMAFESRLG